MAVPAVAAIMRDQHALGMGQRLRIALPACAVTAEIGQSHYQCRCSVERAVADMAAFGEANDGLPLIDHDFAALGSARSGRRSVWRDQALRPVSSGRFWQLSSFSGPARHQPCLPMHSGRW